MQDNQPREEGKDARRKFNDNLEKQEHKVLQGWQGIQKKKQVESRSTCRSEFTEVAAQRKTTREREREHYKSTHGQRG